MWFVRRVSREAIVVSLIVMSVITFFATVWYFKGPYFVHDIVTVMAPLEELFGRIQRSGQSPLWAPEIHGGYPLLAFGQLGYYYPPHMLLRSFLPGVLVVNFSLAGHILMGALAMYAFLRLLHVSPWASGMGSLVYVYGGAVMARFAHIGMVLPLMWVPLCLLALDSLIRNRRPLVGWLIVWVGANVWLVMAGHPQSALMGILVQLIYVGALGWRQAVRLQHLWHLLGGSILITGFLLPHALPVLSFVSASDRAAGLSAEELFEFSAPPQALWGLLIAHPFSTGDTYTGPKGEAELALYVGPVVLGLAGLSLMRRIPPRQRVLWLIGLTLVGVGVVMGLGEYSFIYRWVALNTPQHYFSVPERYFLLLHTGTVFLATLGLHSLPRRWQPWCMMAALLPVFVVAWQWEKLLPSWSAARMPSVVPVLRNLDVTRLWVDDQLIDPSPGDDFGIAVGDAVDTTRWWHQTLTSPYEVVQGVRVRVSRPVDLPAGQLQIRLESPTGAIVRAALIDETQLIDSEWTTASFSPLFVASGTPLTVRVASTWRAPDTPRLIIHTNPDGLDFDPTGFLTLCRRNGCEAVRANGVLADAAIQLVGGDESTVLAHERLAPHVGAGFGIPSGQWTGALPVVSVQQYLTVAQDNENLQDRLGISHRLGWGPPHRSAEAESGAPVAIVPAAGGFIHVVQSDGVWPRWHLAQEVRGGIASDQQLDALRAELPAGRVVSAYPNSRVFSGRGTVEVVRDDRTYLALRTQAAEEEFLVVRDLFFPGWNVFIDGHRAPMWATDALWRGVLVPAGTHEIVFRYWPDWLWPGLVGSGLALVGLWSLMSLQVWTIRQ